MPPAGQPHADPVLGQGKELFPTAFLHIDDLLQVIFVGEIRIQMDRRTVKIHLPGRKTNSEPLPVIGVGAPLGQDISFFRKTAQIDEAG